jgi:hypothetical protein
MGFFAEFAMVSGRERLNMGLRAPSQHQVGGIAWFDRARQSIVSVPHCT